MPLLWIKNNFWKVLKELIPVGFGQFLAALGALAGVRILTQYLSPDEYGKLALGLTLLTLSQQMIVGPLAGSFSRYLSIAKEQIKTSVYFQAVKRLTLFASGIIFLVGIGLLLWAVFNHSFQWVILIIGACLYTIAASISSVYDGIQGADRNRVIVAWHQSGIQWLKIIFAVLFIYWLGANGVNAMLGYALAAGGIVLSQRFFFRKKFQNIKSPVSANTDSKPAALELIAWQKKLLSFAFPFCIWGFFSWLQMSSDRWSLQIFQSSTEVGYYTAVYQIGYYPLSLISNVLVQFLSPILYQKIGSGKEVAQKQKAHRITRILVNTMLAISLLATLVVFWGYPLIFSLLVSVKYQTVAFLLPALILSGGLFATGQICSLTPLNNNQPQKLLLPKITTNVLGIALNFLGAYFFGTIGVVLGILFYSLAYFLWVFFLFRNEPESETASATESVGAI